MSNEWLKKATELKSAIMERAIADYLKNNSQAEIASVAGGIFTDIPEREQASIISTLAANLEATLQSKHADSVQ